MLGLGIPIVYNKLNTYSTNRVSYISDFSVPGNLDGWKPYSSAVDNLTMTAGETAPGESDPSWLKCVYTDDMTTGISGIQLEPFWGTTEDGTVIGDGQSGDYFVFTYKIHIVDGGGKWDPEGDSDAVTVYTQYGASTGFMVGWVTHTINLDTTYSNAAVTGPIVPDASYNGIGQGNPKITFPITDDMPQTGATFYIKDVGMILL